ncbi:MAG: RNase adapter RapZ [Thermodesulfovibrio sp.]|nr:RNase adapter RapZ [Thermodesulfovibrio sp.]
MNKKKDGNKEKTGCGDAVRHPRIVIITGLSGSGKTVALRAVEDLNFFCVDNLPVPLIGALLTRISRNPGSQDVAIGIDIRDRDSLPGFERIIGRLRSRYAIDIIFLEAEPDVLVRRFKETRRPHPLGGNLEEAIASEQKSLAPLKKNADRIIDTTPLSPHQLRRLISSFYISRKKTKDITVALISFGFKYGAPQNVDLLFDVRFLPNPFFIPALKDLDGRDKKVADYVLKHKETKIFLKKVEDLLAFLIPLYVKEGKSYLSVGIGCTGGRHRSPAVVEKIAAAVKKAYTELNVIHRDIS